MADGPGSVTTTFSSNSHAPKLLVGSKRTTNYHQFQQLLWQPPITPSKTSMSNLAITSAKRQSWQPSEPPLSDHKHDLSPPHPTNQGPTLYTNLNPSSKTKMQLNDGSPNRNLSYRVNRSQSPTSLWLNYTYPMASTTKKSLLMALMW